MPIVRLSGRVLGETDPRRETRAQLLYQLFRSGWDIYNSNGDQRVSLGNIQRKIEESGAFVFLPEATLEDLFKAVSVFVGYQTLDADLAGKSTVIMNSDGSWADFFTLLESLHRRGTIKQRFREYLLETHSIEGVVETLKGARAAMRAFPPAAPAVHDGPSFEREPVRELRGNVCVFCSASTTDKELLSEGYSLGRELAWNDLGCISGAGNAGVMGTVVRGAIENGGWTGGSNVPHIIQLEGLPEGISSFWLRPDIYTRMEVMIERSDAFIIFPGGAGTVQETLALIIYKHQKHPAMAGKPVVLYNRQDEHGGFWDPLHKLLEPWVAPGDLTIVRDYEQLVPVTLQSLDEHAPVREEAKAILAAAAA